MNEYIVGAWQPEDNAEILKIWKQTQVPLCWDPLDESDLTAKITGSESFEPEGAIAARVDGRTIGFSLAVATSSPVGHLCTLMVDPAFRGRGIGASLLKRAEDFLATRHTEQVRVASEESPVWFSFGVNVTMPAYYFLLNRSYRSTSSLDIVLDIKLADFELGLQITDFVATNSRDDIAFGLCGDDHTEKLCEFVDHDPLVVSAVSGRPPHPVVIAYQGDRVVGFSGPISVGSGGCGGFMGVVTDPEFRRRKIGTILFQFMCDEMKKRGATHTNLYTGLQQGAQEIYLAAGCSPQYVTDHSLSKRL